MEGGSFRTVAQSANPKGSEKEQAVFWLIPLEASTNRKKKRRGVNDKPNGDRLFPVRSGTKFFFDARDAVIEPGRGTSSVRKLLKRGTLTEY